MRKRLGDQVPGDITRADIRAFVRAITRAPHRRRSGLPGVRRIFSWAVAEGTPVDASPCVGLGGKRKQKRVLLAEEKPRDRIQPDEIRAIFAALPERNSRIWVP